MKAFALAGLLTLAAAPTFAQTPPPAQPPPGTSGQPSGQAAQPPAKVDLAMAIRNSHNTIKGNLLKSAEKMSEADYAFKPAGIMPEVRTYGQFIGHVADANYLLCARAKGEANPMGQTSIEKTKTARADLIKALSDAIAYCDTVYSTLTDAQALEFISVPGPNNTTRQIVRAAPLMSNNAHNNEHYGNLVTYMRVKGIIPPSSEPR
ncbi:MAG: DinB family protein [Vicinamibacterales bacterium]